MTLKDNNTESRSEPFRDVTVASQVFELLLHISSKKMNDEFHIKFDIWII